MSNFAKRSRNLDIDLLTRETIAKAVNKLLETGNGAADESRTFAKSSAAKVRDERTYKIIYLSRAGGRELIIFFIHDVQIREHD